jgi:hypothetical protein
MDPGMEMIRGFGIASNRFDALYKLEGCVHSFFSVLGIPLTLESLAL